MGQTFYAGYEELWWVWKQQPKFPMDLKIGPLRDNIAQSRLWWQQADTIAFISWATTSINGEVLVAH